MSLLPLPASVSQGQELWYQVPPSYLPWLCLALLTEAFLKAAQLLQQLPTPAQEPAERPVRRQVGADQDGSAFVRIETQSFIINGGSKGGLR